MKTLENKIEDIIEKHFIPIDHDWTDDRKNALEKLVKLFKKWALDLVGEDEKAMLVKEGYKEVGTLHKFIDEKGFNQVIERNKVRQQIKERIKKA